MKTKFISQANHKVLSHVQTHYSSFHYLSFMVNI